MVQKFATSDLGTEITTLRVETAGGDFGKILFWQKVQRGAS